MRSLITSMSALLLTTNVALAAPHQSARQGEPSAADSRSLAQDEIALGERAFKRKRLRVGIKHYERAYRHVPSPELLQKIASTYDQIPSACHESLRAWRRFRLRCASCGLKTIAKDGYYSARKRCQRTLNIEASSDLSVVIDQERLGAAPLSAPLIIGAHKIELIRGSETVYRGRFKVSPKRRSTKLQFEEIRGKVRLKRAKRRAHKRKVAHKVQGKTQGKTQEQTIHGGAEREVKLTERGVVVNASLQCEYKRNGRYYPFPDCDGAQLSANDRFRVIFTARQDSFVYLFLNNTHGTRAMLFPDPGVQNFARAGVEYVIPGEGWYELDDEGGTTEKLNIIVARKRVEALERSRGLNLTPQVLDELKRMSFRGIRRMRTPASMSERLKALDTVIESEGSPDFASVNFSIQHD